MLIFIIGLILGYLFACGLFTKRIKGTLKTLYNQDDPEKPYLLADFDVNNIQEIYESRYIVLKVDQTPYFSQD